MTYTIKKTGQVITREELDNYEAQGLSEQEIAKALGISRIGLRKIRKKMNWPQKNRSDKGKYRVPPEIQRERRNAYMREYVAAKDIRYKSIRHNGKIRAEHRVIAENVLGRPLKKGEVVHHINGNRKDNRNSNLLICTADYHRYLHFAMRAKEAQGVR